MTARPRPAHQPNRRPNDRANRRAAHVLALLLLPLLALPACMTVTQDTTTADHGVVVGQWTREDVYERLGAPDGYSGQPRGNEILVYNHAKTHGMKFGVVVLLTPFTIENTESKSDSVFIEIGRDGRVARVVQRGGQADPDWSLWPWGDGSAEN